MYITGYARNNEITESDKEMKAIHHAGIPAAPPVSMAVSRPPPNSAPISTKPQFPRSVTDQQDRGPSSRSVASLFTSESTKGRKESAFSDVLISNSRTLSICSVSFQLHLKSHVAPFSCHLQHYKFVCTMGLQRRLGTFGMLLRCRACPLPRLVCRYPKYLLPHLGWLAARAQTG